VNDLQYLRVWLSRIRAKIEADPGNPKILKTLTGIGYMFEPNGGARVAVEDGLVTAT
jgi:DNA-binding response OmpR family regulator